jgi:ubiquinone/menaquinone biosynthesis C-methylase UbiE
VNFNKSPTTRFSNRVENYIKYRPEYPKEMYDFLIKEFHLDHDSTIADIGSGTGIFAEPLLKSGFTVTGVEPNYEMRKAAEEILAGYKNFISVNGTAENTTLTGNSADLITAAQAFHWFDIDKCKEEFIRIRKNVSTPVALIWNERKVSTDFLKEYEELLNKFATDYNNVDHRNIDNEKLALFYGSKNWQMKIFENHQDFDLESLMGRAFSSSYIPLEGEKGYDEIYIGLENIFDKFNKDGIVRFEYDTNLYWGGIRI